MGSSLWWLLSLQRKGFRAGRLWYCGMWAQWLQLAGYRAQAQGFWRMGLVALRHVGSSQTRDQTPVSCIGRQILYHCVTREAPLIVLNICWICSDSVLIVFSIGNVFLIFS